MTIATIVIATSTSTIQMLPCGSSAPSSTFTPSSSRLTTRTTSGIRMRERSAGGSSFIG